MIKELCLKTWHDWKVLFKDRAYMLSLFAGIFLLAFAIGFTGMVSEFKEAGEFVSVGDIILDNIPTVNMEFFFSWGIYLTVLLIAIYTILFQQEKLPFTMKSYALLLTVRACFILLTNFGPPDGHIYQFVEAGSSVIDEFSFKNDLFFSGHTAVPFLAFLLFRESKIRFVFLFSTIIQAITVLLMHVHYSIDVFAAPFITYGIYAFSNHIFNDLNVRFRMQIKRYGWNALKVKMKTYRNRKKLGLVTSELQEDTIEISS